MKDNLSIVVTMIVFVALMVIFPLYNYFERQDDMSYNLALKSTTNFVDSVISSGYLDQELYDKFVSELANTGMYFDIELEVQRKVYTKDPYEVAAAKTADEYDKIPFIEQYYSEYNNDIFNEDTGTIKDTKVNSSDKKLKNGCCYLNEGDKIYVKIKNSSTTMAGAIFSIIVPTSSTERVKINYGGIVKNNAWKETPQSQITQGDVFVRIDAAKDNTSVNIGSSITFNVTVTNYDKNSNNALKIKEVLKNNIKMKLMNNTSTTFIQAKEVTTPKLDDTNETSVFNVEFEIDSSQKSGQYEVILPANLIQGKIGKNLETKSRVITITNDNNND